MKVMSYQKVAGVTEVFEYHQYKSQKHKMKKYALNADKYWLFLKKAHMNVLKI